MPVLYTVAGKPKSFINSAGLADEFAPVGGSSYIDVHAQFPWTYSYAARENAPFIELKEYAVNESAIKRQLFFYGAGIANFTGGQDRLAPYAELFPRDQETGFVYRLPFFTDINFELNTPQWKSLDTLEAAGNAIEGTAGVLGGKGAANVANKAMEIGGNIIMAGLSLGYPKVGIMDRPKLWESHDFRSYTIKFPLFNTKTNTTKYGTDDWKINREFCFLFLYQNLFNKRDFITGIPPVYYEVSVPGQHYSYASCVTNVTVNNRGNVRLLKDDSGMLCNVPDVYEVNITITDMVMPSKNLLQSINDQTVIGKVSKSTRREASAPAGDTSGGSGGSNPLDGLRSTVEGAARDFRNSTGTDINIPGFNLNTP